MKPGKVVGAVLAGYAALVAVVTLGIAVVQPGMDKGIVLTTTNSDGAKSERMLAGVWMDDHLYVSANQWPRFWYYAALENPAVEVTVKGERGPYTAVPVTGEERDRIAVAYPFPPLMKFLTGFAPRRFLRLDPR